MPMVLHSQEKVPTQNASILSAGEQTSFTQPAPLTPSLMAIAFVCLSRMLNSTFLHKLAKYIELVKEAWTKEVWSAVKQA